MTSFGDTLLAREPKKKEPTFGEALLAREPTTASFGEQLLAREPPIDTTGLAEGPEPPFR